MSSDDFKALEFADKEVFDGCLRMDSPLISELTFTNLFMWRHQYRPLWRLWNDCLLVVFQPERKSPFGLFPIGVGDKREALDFLCGEMRSFTPDVRIGRVDEVSVHNFADFDRYSATLDGDNSDYVYLTEDLIHLAGKKYHRKKNHLNQFVKKHAFEYRPLDGEMVECVLEMQEAWCQVRECVESPGLLSEDYAIHEALTRFGDLDYQGGTILINGKVEAFTLGEPLNKETAVIHIEKANPEIPGLYAAINQLFCMKAWSHMRYVNREQDLGIEGMRQAKESYYPHHMVNKYTLIPK